MKKAVFMGALVGGIIAFVWSFISWMALPWYKNSLMNFKSYEQVASVIKENTCGQGIYLLPGGCGEDDQLSKQRYECGPIMFAAITPDGKSFNMGANLVIQFIMLFVAAGVVTYVIAHYGKSSYGSRLFGVTLFGFFLGWLTAVPSWNWWSFPVGFSFVQFFDMLIMWFLAGLAIAKFAHVRQS